VDGVGESVNRVGVVEWLSTESLVEESVGSKRSAEINVLVRLNNPN